MSTRSSITVQLSDKRFASIYCHFDGYIDGVGKTLFEHYNSQEKVEELVKHGELSQLFRLPGKPEGHTFETPVPGYNVYYGRDRGEKGVEATFSSCIYGCQSRQEYNYVWQDGNWYLDTNCLKLLSEFLP